ncbi:hypothetical protein GCM10010199_61560 [Dactylosporangium roseum]
MLRDLIRRHSDHIGRHAVDHQAPDGTECDGCGKADPAVALACCSICESWMCSTCFSQHKAPDSFYQPQTRRAWWLRMVGRG